MAATAVPVAGVDVELYKVVWCILTLNIMGMLMCARSNHLMFCDEILLLRNM